LENPSTGALVGEIARGTADDIDAAVHAARAAFDGAWGRSTALERGRILAPAAQAVLAQDDDLAAIVAQDMCKPLTQARNDAVALARYLEFYGGAADKLQGETIPYQEGYTVLTLREPHGVTGHIVPWNYPMQIIGRSVRASLAAGNAFVLKPAEEACLTALAFARIMEEAGLSAGVLNVVLGLGEEAGAALVAQPGINHLSFTGSGPVGTLVQQAEAHHAVPVTLELGGIRLRSYLMTPIWTRRCRFWSTQASRTRVRHALPRRGSLCSVAALIAWQRPWPHATAPCGLAPQRRIWTLAR